MPLSPGHSEWTAAPDPAAWRLTGRRPLVGVLASVVFGLLLAHVSPLSALFWLALAWAAALAVLLPVHGALRTGALHLALLSLAAAHGVLSAVPVSPEHLVNRLQRDGEHLALRAVIADDPTLHPGRREGARVWRFPVVLEEARRVAEWEPAQGRIRVRWETTNAAAVLRYGQRVQVEGPVRAGDAPLAAPPELRLSVDDRGLRVLDGDGGWWLRRWCLEGRRICSERLGRGLEHHPDAAGLMRALTLGYNHELPERADEAFAKTGTLHIVAISGAHVAMVALLFLAVVRSTGLSQPRWPLLMAPLLVLYALGTGLAPSAVRACLMSIVFFTAYACWRQPDSLSSLALSALLILGVAPDQLARPGFLLSYIVVLGLILFHPVVRDAMRRRWLKPDEPATRWARARRYLLGHGIDLASMNLVAWLVSTPLIVYYFNLVSPVALLANLLAVPLAFLILFSASLSLVLGWLHPALLELFNHAAAGFIDILFILTDLFERAPGAYTHAPAPPGWLIALTLVLLGLWIRGGRRARRVAAVATLALIGIAAWRTTSPRPFDLALQPLGPVAVAHLRIPGEGDWLFDAGPAFTHKTLDRFLDRRGVNRLRAVVLTRATMETAGALPALLQSRPVAEIWIPAAPGRSRAFQELMSQLEATGIRIRRLARGDLTSFADGTFLHVLHPEADGRYPSGAAGGLVLRVGHGPASLILTGPRDARLETALLAAPEDYGAAALIHLASADEPDAFDSPWLDAVRPAWIIRPERPADAWQPPPRRSRPPLLHLLDPEIPLRLRARPGAPSFDLQPDPFEIAE